MKLSLPAPRRYRVLVSADTNFASILAARQAAKPSVILFRREAPRRAEKQAALLLANMSTLTELLEQGSLVVFEDGHLRSRPLPLCKRAILNGLRSALAAYVSRSLVGPTSPVHHGIKLSFCTSPRGP